MPLFGSSSAFEADVEKVTHEVNVSEDWNLILDICDRAKISSAASKDLLRCIVRRLNHRVPQVVKLALGLLNACVKNCGRIFLLEVASREFVDELKNLLTDKTHPKLIQQLRLMIKSWAEGEFKTDPALSLIPSFYYQLKAEGHDFTSDEKPKKTVVLSKDPNVVSSQEEEDDIAKAIAESLKDAESHKSSRSSQHQSSAASGIYPTMSSNSSAATIKPREPKKVRALYDFEAVEDNELTFKAGEIIGVTNDSDPNWWKGVSWRGEGLFPANFVSLDLDSDTPNNSTVEKEKQAETEAAVVSEPEASLLTIDEDKIDRTLVILQNADPTGETCPDPTDLSTLEEQCRAMNPLIDQELEKVDKVHMRLSAVNTELMNALQMYHNLMTEQSSFYTGAPTATFSSIGGTLPPLSHTQQHMVPGGVPATLPHSTISGSLPPPSYATFDQMMSGPGSLSISQIPHGISAQVGPAQAQHQTMMMMGPSVGGGVAPSNLQQTLGGQYSTQPATVQYAHSAAGMIAGPVVQGQQYVVTNLSNNIPATTATAGVNQSMYSTYNTSQQQQQPIYAVPHQMG